MIPGSPTAPWSAWPTLHTNTSYTTPTNISLVVYVVGPADVTPDPLRGLMLRFDRAHETYVGWKRLRQLLQGPARHREPVSTPAPRRRPPRRPGASFMRSTRA